MVAGDTVFGDHKALIAKVPLLLESTEKVVSKVLGMQGTSAGGKDLSADMSHPMVIAARFHGFYEYLHPFRDGNGRTGRLVSNYILLRLGHPVLVTPTELRQKYITALRMIRTESTDEHLVHFFFKMAVKRMREELEQKEANTRCFFNFVF